jgi:hypothetical protein
MPGRRVFLVLLAALAFAGQAFAAGPPVDLQLVLAADVSRSIDSFEHQLQREGYAAALTSPEVLRAIKGGAMGRIAVSYVEWSGTGEAAVLVDWTVIGERESAAGFAERLIAAPRRFFGATSISGAIDFSARLLSDSGFEAARTVIDVSGDGANNSGRPSQDARDDAVRAGITINGLAIINDRPSRAPWPEPPLDWFYTNNVIGGPGAFLVVVKGFETFAESITKKLVREIAEVPSSRHPQTAQDDTE